MKKKILVAGCIVTSAIIGATATACWIPWKRMNVAIYDHDALEILYMNALHKGGNMQDAEKFYGWAYTGIYDIAIGQEAFWHQHYSNWVSRHIKADASEGYWLDRMETDVILVGKKVTEERRKKLAEMVPSAKQYDMENNESTIYDSINKQFSTLKWAIIGASDYLGDTQDYFKGLYKRSKERISQGPNNKVLIVRENEGTYERFGSSGRYAHLFNELGVKDANAISGQDCKSTIIEGCDITEDMWAKIDPSAVILLSDNKNAELTNLPGFKNTSAFKNGNYIKRSDDNFYEHRNGAMTFKGIMDSIVEVVV